MAVGLVDAGGGDGRQYGGRITVFVALSCITAAMGGTIFGYDLGTSGTNTTAEFQIHVPIDYSITGCFAQHRWRVIHGVVPGGVLPGRVPADEG
jgi:hypothetical protein